MDASTPRPQGARDSSAQITVAIGIIALALGLGLGWALWGSRLKERDQSIEGTGQELAKVKAALDRLTQQVASKAGERDNNSGPPIVPPPPPSPPSTLDAKDTQAIRSAEGTVRDVEGTVLSVPAGKSGIVRWIEFSTDRDSFEGTIFSGQFDVFEKKFGNLATTLPGKKVRLYGLIEDYKGRPEIKLNDPAQLELK